VPKIKSVRCAVYEFVSFDLSVNSVETDYKFSRRVSDYIERNVVRTGFI